VAVYAVDVFGRVCFWNAAAETLFGWPGDRVLGELFPGIAELQAEPLFGILEELLDRGSVEEVEVTHRHADGHLVDVRQSITLVNDDAGLPLALLCFARDATDENRQTRALREAEHHWRVVAGRVADTVTVLSSEGTILETTAGLDGNQDVLGYDDESWLGRSGFELLHEDDLAIALADFAHVLEHPGQERRRVVRTRHADGHFEHIEYTATNLLGDPGVGGILLSSRNVTRDHAVTRLAAAEAEVLELIAEDAPLEQVVAAVCSLAEEHCGGGVGVFTVDGEGRLEVVGHGPGATVFARAVDGAPVGDLLAVQGLDLSSFVELVDFATDRRLRGPLWPDELRNFGSGWSVPITDRSSGRLLGCVGGVHPHARRLDEHGHHVIRLAADLAAVAIDRADARERLVRRARFHPVSDLPNRAAVMAALHRALDRARREEHHVAVLNIDLDRFKTVNDSLGHVTGDALLGEIAGRLTDASSADEYVGHFDADEFVVVLERLIDADAAAARAGEYRHVLSDRFDTNVGPVHLSASIGVAVAERGVLSAGTLVQHADIAMDRAKQLGRNQVAVFDEALQQRAVERLRMEGELRRAVTHAGLTVHYQPELDLATGVIVGVEALVRWPHEERGLVPPDQFIGLAEENGLIVPLGRFVLSEALAQARRWVDGVTGLPAGFFVAVNLSARQLTQPGLVHTIAAELARFSWPAGDLILELTESVLAEDATRGTLEELRRLGVQIAIDDFGTGFAALRYLHRFPVDWVKIDRSFLDDLAADGSGAPVASAVVHMAEAFGLSITAEGVETPAQVAGLRRLGCDLAQGFLFTRPVPAEAMTELLATQPWAGTDVDDRV
jgi:diguanylate cyclase (GGDEF)-like protein/PAS domain S-box-containing protein